MGVKLNILTISLLIGIVFGSKLEIEVDSSSSSSIESEEYVEEPDSNEVYPEDIVFVNLRALLRSGDSDFGIPIWAPYVDDNVMVEGLDEPFKFILDGFDTFEKVQTTIRENNTAEFHLFFPRITFFLEWDLNDAFVAVKGTQMNTTLIGSIQYDPQNKCIRLVDIDVALDYDFIDYDIIKRGDVDPLAEEFMFEYADFFRAFYKDEMLDAYEEMIEEEVRDIFKKLECWTYDEENLLSSIKNTI